MTFAAATKNSQMAERGVSQMNNLFELLPHTLLINKELVLMVSRYMVYLLRITVIIIKGYYFSVVSFKLTGMSMPSNMFALFYLN